MAQSVVPDLAIVLTFIRQGAGWDQTRLARAANTDPNVINDYERGRKNLTRARLEFLLERMAVSPERIDATLSCLSGNRSASRAPAEPQVPELGARRAGLRRQHREGRVAWNSTSSRGSVARGGRKRQRRG